MMRSARREILLVGLGALLAPSFCIAEESTKDPLGGVNYLVAWLTKLDSQFDSLVIDERKGQLQRSVDHLRTALYGLETDSRDLLGLIPDARPTGAVNAQLLALEDRLRQTVAQLAKDVRAIGADLRLNDGVQVEMKLSGGVATRGFAISFLRRQLSSNEVWDAEGIRQRLKTGISAVYDAQMAATEFSRKLAGLADVPAPASH